MLKIISLLSLLKGSRSCQHITAFLNYFSIVKTMKYFEKFIFQSFFVCQNYYQFSDKYEL